MVSVVSVLPQYISAYSLLPRQHFPERSLGAFTYFLYPVPTKCPLPEAQMPLCCWLLWTSCIKYSSPPYLPSLRDPGEPRSALEGNDPSSDTASRAKVAQLDLPTPASPTSLHLIILSVSTGGRGNAGQWDHLRERPYSHSFITVHCYNCSIFSCCSSLAVLNLHINIYHRHM